MAFPEGFGRLKKPMVQRMAKLADIKHVSGTMTDDMRVGLHRYLKEQTPLWAVASPNAGETAPAHAPVPFIIPAKTFAFLVQKAADKKMTPEDLEKFHYHVETWWLELFKRSKKVADHREHAVVQWKDVEMVMELARPIVERHVPVAAVPLSAVPEPSRTIVQFTST